MLLRWLPSQSFCKIKLIFKYNTRNTTTVQKIMGRLCVIVEPREFCKKICNSLNMIVVFKNARRYNIFFTTVVLRRHKKRSYMHYLFRLSPKSEYMLMQSLKHNVLCIPLNIHYLLPPHLSNIFSILNTTILTATEQQTSSPLHPLFFILIHSLHKRLLD